MNIQGLARIMLATLSLGDSINYFYTEDEMLVAVDHIYNVLKIKNENYFFINEETSPQTDQNDLFVELYSTYYIIRNTSVKYNYQENEVVFLLNYRSLLDTMALSISKLNYRNVYFTFSEDFIDLLSKDKRNIVSLIKDAFKKVDIEAVYYPFILRTLLIDKNSFREDLIGMCVSIKNKDRTLVHLFDHTLENTITDRIIEEITVNAGQQTRIIISENEESKEILLHICKYLGKLSPQEIVDYGSRQRYLIEMPILLLLNRKDHLEIFECVFSKYKLAKLRELDIFLKVINIFLDIKEVPSKIVEIATESELKRITKGACELLKKIFEENIDINEEISHFLKMIFGSIYSSFDIQINGRDVENVIYFLKIDFLTLWVTSFLIYLESKNDSDLFKIYYYQNNAYFEELRHHLLQIYLKDDFYNNQDVIPYYTLETLRTLLIGSTDKINSEC
ncbi:hypothetical protein NGRA_0773 [Nosema granulosis]|uniref:Uncharacterized protein n=1 Tax=Nosema granulosis TaxID=83296 RepID=A0A9P6KZR1_9MICR|nr:hypothetical protein NGRA_0773 [Nosema granulosis]